MTTQTDPTTGHELAEDVLPEAAAPEVDTSGRGALATIFVRFRWWRALPVVVLLAFALWLASSQANNGVWISAGTDFFTFAAAAVGLNLLIGHTGQLSLGHAAFFLVGGYAGGLWVVEHGWSPYWGFPAAFGAGVVVGTVLALLCCHLKGFYLTVVTLGFGYIIQRAITAFPGAFGRQPRRLQVGFAAIPRYDGVPFAHWASRRSDQNRLGIYVVALVVLLVTMFLARNLVESRWGRAFRSIRDSEIAARASGVATYQTKVVAFAVSSGIVAMAGVIPVMISGGIDLNGASPELSFRLVTFLVLGGLGTVAGPIVGAFGPTFFLSVDWVKQHFGNIVPLLFGAGTLLTVATQPEGAMGAWRRQFTEVRRRFASAGRPLPARPIVEVAQELRQPRARTEGAAGEAVLEVTGLQKRFGGLQALSDIDLTVQRGTVHALIGPNGSGKSTFVNVVTGFYPATDGEVSLLGRQVGHLPTHRRARLGVARTFQNLQVWRRMSVLENVEVGLHDRIRPSLPLCLLGLGFLQERRMERRAWGLLHFVGLADKARQPAGTLAFADQRRLEIARALASEPDLLLLDEPAAGMHPSEVKDLITLVRRIRDAGISVLLIEHHMDLVMDLSDKVTVLDYGRKIAEGTPDEVRADPRVIEAYLGAV